MLNSTSNNDDVELKKELDKFIDRTQELEKVIKENNSVSMKKIHDQIPYKLQENKSPELMQKIQILEKQKNALLKNKNLIDSTRVLNKQQTNTSMSDTALEYIVNKMNKVEELNRMLETMEMRQNYSNNIKTKSHLEKPIIKEDSRTKEIKVSVTPKPKPKKKPILTMEELSMKKLIKSAGGKGNIKKVIFDENKFQFTFLIRKDEKVDFDKNNYKLVSPIFDIKESREKVQFKIGPLMKETFIEELLKMIPKNKLNVLDK